MNRGRRTTSRFAVISLTTTAAAIACLAVVPGASAHGTLNLYGKDAIADKSGKLTLTIPHGCGPNGTSTTRIILKLGSAWQAAKPAAVAGWKSSAKRAANGQRTLTWIATGGGLPNADQGDFPITVRWPKKAGTYNTPTAQYCGSQLMDWKDPFNAAADGDLPYPATYPVPRVRVHASAARTPTAVTGSSPISLCPLDQAPRQPRRS
ncbi:unannotated protein [freshwater metagenome]|uniref:Unannotated protein n=1 Tax=freshwater metagenome TaxID=449393 RepID=A0A6J7RL06_9ZZZZ|nr:DUF1775 domain-containing protein [Actinomycetota bacterium]